jgi:hypothetical protein
MIDMALLKANDWIVLVKPDGTEVPGRRWRYSQCTAAVAEVGREFIDSPLLPLLIVPLKSPTDVLWRIEKR